MGSKLVAEVQRLGGSVPAETKKQQLENRRKARPFLKRQSSEGLTGHNGSQNGSLVPPARVVSIKPSSSAAPPKRVASKVGSSLPPDVKALSNIKKLSIVDLPIDKEFDSDDEGSSTKTVHEIAVKDAFGTTGNYSGSVSIETNMPHGSGRMEYGSDRWYQGEWTNGHWHGTGRYRNIDGDVFEGKIINDRKQNGRLDFSDGRVFEGTFEDDKMKTGTMRYSDGSAFSGSFAEGKRDGFGTYNFADGSSYEGDFRNNVFHGEGKMMWGDGGFYKGEWRAGEMHGRGKEVAPDGTVLYFGLWRHGEPI